MPTLVGDAEQLQDEGVGEEGGGAHVCEECGEGFTSRRAMCAHSMRLHGRRKLIYQCTLTNQCPWCASVFADQKIAAKHAANSFFS
eukprot:2383422-Heterocapsa_arctica.AAC.1